MCQQPPNKTTSGAKLIQPRPDRLKDVKTTHGSTTTPTTKCPVRPRPRVLVPFWEPPRILNHEDAHLDSRTPPNNDINENKKDAKIHPPVITLHTEYSPFPLDSSWKSGEPLHRKTRPATERWDTGNLPLRDPGGRHSSPVDPHLLLENPPHPPRFACPSLLDHLAGTRTPVCTRKGRGPSPGRNRTPPWISTGRRVRDSGTLEVLRTGDTYRPDGVPKVALGRGVGRRGVGRRGSVLT